MPKKKSGLGKGLDALFAENTVDESLSASAVSLDINEIEPNREQPRKVFEETALRELAESIERHGIVQPLLVRPMADGSYQLVAGERRWRAARMAGLSEVPVVIRELSDRDTMEIALIENLQREDLNPIEEATALRQLMEAFALTQEECAERVGKSRSAVANSLRLLNLPQSLIDLVQQGELSSGHARTILPLADEAKMLDLAKEIKAKDLSVRDTERQVKILLSDATHKVRPKVKTKDKFYEEVELALRNTMNRKVRVLPGKSHKGTLEIEFFSKEDLQKLANALEE